jgi:hypothetical protein
MTFQLPEVAQQLGARNQQILCWWPELAYLDVRAQILPRLGRLTLEFAFERFLPLFSNFTFHFILLTAEFDTLL